MAFDSKRVYTSPKGSAVWPKLIKPETKFDKDGVYTTKLSFTPEAEAAFIKDMTVLFEQAYQHICLEQKNKMLKRAAFPWKPEVEVEKDSEGNVIKETPTGKMLFTFKLKSKVTTKAGEILHFKPSYFDGKGQAIKNVANLNIGGGSTLKIAFTVRPFFMAKEKEAGMGFQIKGVQLINLVESGGISADRCGFGAEEGGYEGGTESEATSEPSAPGSEAPDPKDSDF